MTHKDDFIPTPLEAVFYAVLTVVITLIGILRFLTDYLAQDTYNASETFVKQASTYFHSGLEFIDSFSFSPSTAVFLFWSLAGVVVFSLLQAVYNLYAAAKEDVDISTHFLHPRNFVQSAFWVEVLLQTLAHFSLFVMLLLCSLVVGFALTPLSVSSAQTLFDGVNLSTVLGFLASFVMLYVGVVVLAVILKLFLKRKQVII
jgi:hypothetical protein